MNIILNIGEEAQKTISTHKKSHWYSNTYIHLAAFFIIGSLLIFNYTQPQVKEIKTKKTTTYHIQNKKTIQETAPLKTKKETTPPVVKHAPPLLLYKL